MPGKSHSIEKNLDVDVKIRRGNEWYLGRYGRDLDKANWVQIVLGKKGTIDNGVEKHE